MKRTMSRLHMSLAIAAAFGSVVLVGSAIAAGSGSPVATSSGIKCKGGTPGETAKGPECGPKVRASDMRKAVAAAVPATLAPAFSEGSSSYGPESLHQIGACGSNLAIHRKAELGGCKVSTTRITCNEAADYSFQCGPQYSCDRFVLWLQKGKIPGQSPDGPQNPPGFGSGSVLTTVPFKKQWKLRVYNYGPDREPLPECVVVF